MGGKIAATGLVVFFFCLIIGSIARQEPKQPGIYKTFGILMLIGLFAIPIGLIMGIWGN